MAFYIDYDIGESELEPNYKHVHHAHTVKLLELGRIKLLEKLNMPLEYWIERELYLVITRLQVSFYRELFAGPIKIGCYSPQVEEKTLRLSQSILNAKDKVAIRALVEMKFISEKRAVLPPPEFVSAFLGEVDI